MHYIVALTGGIGSGKSTVANAFAELGATIVDADVIARQVVEPGSEALRAIHARFGDNILLPDGMLNRPLLRRRIFSSPQDKVWLNALLHPLIQHGTRQRIANATGDYVLWVVPLLLENHLQSQADRVLVVDVEPEVQIARTLRRDGIDREQIENILAAQATREQRLACADDIIDNSGRPNAITANVAKLHRHYIQLATSATRQD
ncbi:dephospho-CoA kinase [Acerihabitans sp. TG2]|uniref:dephospho-CoA kinase n=1 Tax=Acerihabitans sp. TG2 TaxID=3096008 RepID=UPI002B225DBD|nr:dephospho-CoA kinase [Acerihabitans sp. TG2]MEA9391796.1 dephospho-CoA kinase [Acerihabitans sp. TG2]